MNQRTRDDVVALFDGAADLALPGPARPLGVSAPATLPRPDARARSGQRPFPRPPRRSQRLATSTWVSLPAVFTTFAITLLAAVAITLPGAGTPSAAFEQAGGHATFLAGTAMLAAMCGVMLLVFARYGDHVAAAWAGGAMLVLGLVTMGSGTVATAVEAAAVPQVVAWVQPGSRLAVIALLAMALWTSRRGEIWRRRPSRIALISTATLALGVLLAAAAPRTMAAFGGIHDLATITAGASSSPLLMVTWAATSALYLTVAFRRRDALLGWVALAIAALAATEAAGVAAASAGLASSVTAHGVHAAGLTVLLLGVIRTLARSVQRQRLLLLRRAIDAEAQADDHARRQKVQVHEARNALSGVVNTLRLLDAQHVRLDDDTQRSLLAASFAELMRLQQVFTLDDHADAAGSYRLADALSSVLAASRAGGMTIDVDMPTDLEAYGSWSSTAQAVQNLLENARRYAPGSPVRISARRSADHVELRVVDHGPGLAADEQDHVFDSGIRGTASTGTRGSGLGLTISQELLARQQGRIWTEPTPGGGATFVLILPAPTVQRDDDGRVDAQPARDDEPRLALTPS